MTKMRMDTLPCFFNFNSEIIHPEISHAAVSYSHTALVEFLISNSANLDLLDEDGESPLFVCEEVEMAEVKWR